MKKLFKIFTISLLSLIVLLLVAVTVLVAYLSPSRLTPIVEKQVNDRIDGRLDVGKVELTFWSSFPHLEVDVESMTLLSGVMIEWPDSGYRSPVAPDSLMSVSRIHAGINMFSLARGHVDLYDVYIDRPRVNIVMGADGMNNYNIFKNEEDSGERVDTLKTGSSVSSLPPISIDRFRLIDAGPLTFTSIPDSLYVSVMLKGTSLSSSALSSGYRLEIDGNASSDILDIYKMTPLTVDVNGHIGWDPGRPAAVKVQGLDIKVNEFAMRADADVDATDSLVINSLYVSLDTVNVNSVIAHLPQEMSKPFDGLETDMLVTLDANLTAPYTIGDSLTIPSIQAHLNIAPAFLYLGDIHMDKIDVDVTANVDGSDLDNSTCHIERCDLQGRAVDVNMSGDVTGPVENPYVDGRIAAALRLNSLPGRLLNLFPVKVAGTLTASTTLRLHRNDLTPTGFHRIYLDGRAKLKDFAIESNDSLMQAMAGCVDLDFGTTRTLRGSNYRADSMLTVSLDIDTVYVDVPGLKVQGRALEADMGTMNKASSADTTVINPFGGTIRINSLILDQTGDSMSLRLREVNSRATLSRYQGISRNPHVNFDLSARRIGLRGTDYSMVVSQPSVTIQAHIIPAKDNKSRSRRGISPKTSRVGRNMHSADSTAEVIDWNVNNDLKTLLKRWNITGEMKSNRAFIFTSSFPLRQRASDIDLAFSTDSVNLKSMNYSIGRSRMGVSGRISNIERALAGRNNRGKLRVDFTVHAPFIDINELSSTAFAEASGIAGPDADYDEEVAFVVNTPSDSASRPLLIPSNIDAHLAVRADSILYSDLLMYGMRGEVLINNSAINLSNLTANTEIGSATLSALYWAPDTTNMKFGMGLKLNRFHVDRVLSLIPAVDSLLPALQGFAGIINADMAASSRVTPQMNIDLPSFKAALKLDGDSLVLLDADTFKMLSKWLVFKNKKRNMIDSMSVEIAVADNEVQIYPFIFDIDRYRLGVMGHNDMDMNLDYHVSVLKSPLPFKFGINIKGNLDKYKIRFGGAKIKPGTVARYAIADSTRINLLTEIEDVFRRGSMAEAMVGVRDSRNKAVEDVSDEVITAADSALMRQEGFLPPDSVPAPPVELPTVKSKKNGRK